MIDENHIKFTAQYDNKGYLTIIDVDKNKMESERKKIYDSLKKKKLSKDQIEEKVEEELSKVQNAKARIEKLNWKEEAALVNIDLLKEQLVNMIRIKRDSGKDGFELVPEKRNRMHDDHAYVAAMMGYALSQERRKNIIRRKKINPCNIAEKLAAQIKTSTRRTSIFE